MKRLHALACLVLLIYRKYAYGDHVQEPRAFSLRLSNIVLGRIRKGMEGRMEALLRREPT